VSNESDVYGFLAELDDDELRVADCFGGGATVDANQLREDVITDVRRFIESMAHEYAEAIVDQLDAGYEVDPADLEPAEAEQP